MLAAIRKRKPAVRKRKQPLETLAAIRKRKSAVGKRKQPLENVSSRWKT